jgi:hypothetical protein
MGIFNGNIGTSTTASHTFIILDSHFQNYGVGSLTKKGFADFKETDFGKRVLSGRTTTDIFTALNLPTSTNGIYTCANNGSYVQTNISQNNLLSLIDYHESGEASTDNKNVDKDETIKNIKSSIEGFVWFPPSGQNVTNYASGCALKLYFYAPGQHKNDRIVSNNGSPMITDIPRSSTGRKFLASQSKEARLNKVDDFFNIGTYVGTNEENNITEDVKDSVTGPLRLSWNETFGQWEVSNQILARLLSDLNPANIVGFEVSSNDTDNTNSKKFYDINSEKYMGQRSVGVAMPLAMQNNNPDMFGPNLIKCKSNYNVEKIKVVNRSNESFKAGDIVLCSLIGCEWIVQKFGTLEVKPQPSSVGRWGFYKFMANSDSFFRSAISGYKEILPDQCQKYLRYKFYNSLSNVSSSLETNIASKTDVANLNLNNPAVGSFKEYSLDPYIQTSSFDLTDKLYGGTCESGNSYNRINIEKASSATDSATYRTVPLYWGPVFPDGYSSSYLNTSRTGDAKIMAEKSSGSPINSSSYYLSGGFDSNAISSGFFSIDDVPADIAVNGQYGKTSFPIEHTSGIISAFNGSNCASDINFLLNSGVRAYFLADSGNKDVYGFTPNNPLKVQFSPLCAELACSDDSNTLVVSDVFKLNGRNFYTSARQVLGRSINESRSLHGKLITRLPANLDVQGTKWDWLYGSNPRINLPYVVPYDCYIERTPLNRPLAAPYIFTDQVYQNVGANLVGIIAARNTFQKNKGGNLNISAKQLFGLYGKFIGNGGGGSIDVTILGSIGSWVTNNTSSFKARYSPIWGSTMGDSINSFGTTALHAMVWDYWPEKHTAFIPQYFSVAHFNSGILFSAPSTQSGVAPENKTITTYVDKIDYSDLDFRIPSYARASGVAGNHSVVLENAIIESGTKLAADNEWRVNTVRRGQMVTEEGFYYQKRVIGLNISSLTVSDGGSGFAVGDIININNDLSIEVTTVSGSAIQSADFAIDKTFENKIPSTFLNKKAGSGFKPSDFKSPYSMQVKSPTGGKNAILKFTQGRAYSKIMHDQGPKKRTPITRLSSSSGEGTSRVEETKNTTLGVEDNTGFKYAGKYEAFYFFHNDITHTFNNADSIEANPDFAQHITITIS